MALLHWCASVLPGTTQPADAAGVRVCMIMWDVVSSRALLRLRKKLPFEKWMETPLHNEQAAQWFQANAPAVACHQVARHAPNHPATVSLLV